jgi:hypothetical protein
MGVFTRAVSAMLLGLVAAHSQTAEERVFRSVHTDSVQELNELATVIRSIGEIREVNVDTAGKIISIRGTPAQIALADWLFTKLDQPAGQGSGVQEYTMTGAEPLHAVRLFFIKNAAGIQQFQEMATVVRSITEVRHVFTYNVSKALVFRGTPEQMEAAQWLIAELDHAPAPGPRASPEFRMEGTRHNDNVARVYYLNETVSVSDFQELATLIRSLAEIRRVFMFNPHKAVALRGTATQMEMAQWMVTELNLPLTAEPAPVQARIFNLDNDPENTVQLFRFPNTGTVAHFNETAASIRARTGIRRAFVHNTRRVLVMRGTADQIAEAERLINERKR